MYITTRIHFIMSSLLYSLSNHIIFCVAETYKIMLGEITTSRHLLDTPHSVFDRLSTDSVTWDMPWQESNIYHCRKKSVDNIKKIFEGSVRMRIEYWDILHDWEWQKDCVMVLSLTAFSIDRSSPLSAIYRDRNEIYIISEKLSRNITAEKQTLE